MRRAERVTMLMMLLMGRAAGLTASDWPQWRGPLGTDVVNEASGWRDGQWRLSGPVWEASAGPGASSPTIAGGCAFVMGWSENHDTLLCLDAVTGERRWRGSYPCPPYGRFAVADQGFYKGPSATPTCDPATDCVYTLSTDGDLVCWEVRRHGRVLWRRNLHETSRTSQRPDSGGGIRDYGYTASPLLYGDWVIVEAGGADGNLVAFDKQSGEVRWRSECTDPAGHTGGPVPMAVEGVPCVAVLTLRNLVVTRLDEGRVGQTLATHPWQTQYANNIPTPTVEGNTVILTSGFNQSRIVKLRVEPGGVQQVWETAQYSGVCSPVIYHDRVYFVRDQVWCLDYASGQVLWSGGAFGDDASCLVTGDGRLVVFGDRQLALVDSADRSPGEYRELALRPGVGQSYSWPHVALAGGRLYAKDSQGAVYCFEVEQ
jgi:outer membrane protein assembly factor BamB